MRTLCWTAALTLLLTASLNAEQISLTKLATHQTGIFDGSAAEIVAFDTKTKRLFVVNAEDDTIDVLDLPNMDVEACELPKLKSIDLAPGSPNSVAARHGLIAVAVEANPKQNPGWVVFFDAQTCEELKRMEVGALPDMLTFTPNGRYVLVANEGEPDDYVDADDGLNNDPEGSISIIDLQDGVKNCKVRTADFDAFNDDADDLRAAGVRIFGPGAMVAEDLEPEYIASVDNRLAYVVCQENNAMAVVDIRRAKVVDILPLGYQDHSAAGKGLDPSDRDDGINIGNWPVCGMYQPDAIAAYKRFGKTFIISANEGDARDYDGFSEEERIKDVVLDPATFPNAADLQEDDQLGRLNITSTQGTNGEGEFTKLFSFGSRSISIWTHQNGQMVQVFDSGDELEQTTAAAFPDDFNSNNDENDSFESRSDNKGPEPEGITLGRIGFRTYAFVGLERVGGVAIYDVTNPLDPALCGYTNNRDFTVDADLGGGVTNPDVGDLGPEGLTFIPRQQSPTGKPLLVTANEVSGTTTVFEVVIEREPGSGDVDEFLDGLFDALDDFLSGLPF